MEVPHPRTMPPQKKPKAMMQEIQSKAERGQWDQVFELCGCRLTLKEPGQNIRNDSDRVASLLEAIRKDFWDKRVTLEPEICYSFDHIDRTEIVRQGMFPSVNIEFLQPLYVSQNHVNIVYRIFKAAMGQEQWPTITAVLFLLARFGIDNQFYQKALKWAVDEKDWRYVTTVFGAGLKMFCSKPGDILQALGLSTNEIQDRGLRINTLSKLLGPQRGDRDILAFVIKTLICWARIDSDDDVSNKWIIALETMEDFEYSNVQAEEFLLKNFHMKKVYESKCFHELFTYALDWRNYTLLADLVMYEFCATDLIELAFMCACHDKAWDTLFNCVKAMTMKGVHLHMKGETGLHLALGQHTFKLAEVDVRKCGVNVRCVQGRTLLHVAIDRSLQPPRDIRNIHVLLNAGADILIPFPNGDTVLYKIMYGENDDDTNYHRCVLLDCFVPVLCQREDFEWKQERQGVECDVLHLLCSYGRDSSLSAAIAKGANPLKHKNGFTLIDTAIRDQRGFDHLQKRTIEYLCKIQKVKDNHKEKVRTSFIQNRQSDELLLTWLLERVKAQNDKYHQLIILLAENQVITKLEFKEAEQSKYLHAIGKEVLGEVRKKSNFLCGYTFSDLEESTDSDEDKTDEHDQATQSESDEDKIVASSKPDVGNAAASSESDEDLSAASFKYDEDNSADSSESD